MDDLDAPAPSDVGTDILSRDEDGELEFHGTVESIDIGNVLTRITNVFQSSRFARYPIKGIWRQVTSKRWRHLTVLGIMASCC